MTKLAPAGPNAGSTAPRLPRSALCNRGRASAGASLVILLGLAGCAGTASNPTGVLHATASIDPRTGVQTIEVHDGKDRSGLTAQLVERRPDGSSVSFNLSETDINGSAAQAQALAAQSANLGKALDLVGTTLGAAVKLAPVPVPKP